MKKIYGRSRKKRNSNWKVYGRSFCRRGIVGELAGGGIFP